jgi:hypothetical protein
MKTQNQKTGTIQNERLLDDQNHFNKQNHEKIFKFFQGKAKLERISLPGFNKNTIVVLGNEKLIESRVKQYLESIPEIHIVHPNSDIFFVSNSNLEYLEIAGAARLCKEAAKIFKLAHKS